MEKDSNQKSQGISDLANAIIEKEALIAGECFEVAFKDGVITKEEFLEEPLDDNFEHIMKNTPEGNVIITKSLRLNKEIFRVVTYTEENEIKIQGLLTYRLDKENRKNVKSEIKVL
jgi:hypothetical protein